MQLQELYLHTGMLPQMRHFYAQILDCTVMDVAGGFLLKAGATDLYFQGSAHNHTYHFAFNIPFDQVTEAMEWTGRKVPLLGLGAGNCLADFKNWLAKAFYFLDPAGNIVEFIGREPVGGKSSAPFSGSSLLCASEIGIVTNDVALTCGQMQEVWQVPLFERQPPAQNFAASGGDNGLFIIVSAGRPWYPTQIPAQKAPLKALFVTNGKSRTLEIS